MSGLRKPVKRNRKRLVQRNSDDEQENRFMENFQQVKKQRTERSENAKKLATVKFFFYVKKKKSFFINESFYSYLIL